MSARATPATLLSLCEVMREMHRIATGQEITQQQAREYFRNPKRLAEVVESSGAVNDPEKSAALRELLESNKVVSSDKPGREESDGI